MNKPTIDRDLFDHLSTAIVCVDRALDVVFMNTAAESLLSISERKASLLNLMDIVEVPDSLLVRMQEALQHEQAYNDRQVTLGIPGGDDILVDCTITPFRKRLLANSNAEKENPKQQAHELQNHGPQNPELPKSKLQKPEPQNSLLLNSEAQNSKLTLPVLEDEGTQVLLEMTHLNRQLRIAREEALVNQQESSRSLLRGLAHEIKNPLGGLRGAAQLLEGELDDDDLKEYTGIIIRESDRLQQLIDRMLGPANRPVMQLLNIHAVLEYVRKIISAEAGPAVSLRNDYDPSIPEFVCDHDRLVQVFLNIAGNALHAVGFEGNIWFKTRVISSFTIGTVRHRLVVMVEIIDDGNGISEELQQQIFFPLVTGRSDGTGLGLSIAQTTINQLGGLIECHSKPQQTVFTVYLPINEGLSTGHANPPSNSGAHS